MHHRSPVCASSPPPMEWHCQPPSLSHAPDGPNQSPTASSLSPTRSTTLMRATSQPVTRQSAPSRCSPLLCFSCLRADCWCGRLSVTVGESHSLRGQSKPPRRLTLVQQVRCSACTGDAALQRAWRTMHPAACRVTPSGATVCRHRSFTVQLVRSRSLPDQVASVPTQAMRA